jgi:hypothetical protein
LFLSFFANYLKGNLSVFRNSNIEAFTLTVANNPENLQVIYFLCRLWRLLLLDKLIGDDLLEKTEDPENNPASNPIIGVLCDNPNANNIPPRNFLGESMLLLKEFQRLNVDSGYWCVLKPEEIEKLKKVLL